MSHNNYSGLSCQTLFYNTRAYNAHFTVSLNYSSPVTVGGVLAITRQGGIAQLLKNVLTSARLRIESPEESRLHSMLRTICEARNENADKT